MKLLLLGLLALPTLGAAPAPQTFTGTITDSECADANHARMRMGDTDAECVKACIDEHGAAYVLYDGRKTYELSDQKAPAAFAGRRVSVRGTLDANGRRILVDSIVAAK